MSFLIRPTFVFALIFGCFAALVPRILFPLFRSKPSTPSTHPYENFRRTPISSGPVDTSNSAGHEFNAMDVPTDQASPDTIEPIPIDPTESKSMFTFALPMYSVGIVVFFLYTCCKYFSRRNRQEMKLRERYSSENIRWNADQRQFKYETKTRIVEDVEDNEEEGQYAGLDPDYVAYLKARREKEKEVQRANTAEQTKVHHTLDSLKNSLSFINTKLAANESRGNLSHNELSELQNRLAATEAQMYQLLSAIDAASNKVQELTNKTSRQSLENSSLKQLNEEDDPSLSDNHSLSHEEEDDDDEDEEDEEDEDEDEEDEEDEDDGNEEEDKDGSSSSSNEEDEHREDEDDQSEISSERYGLMETNYDCDPDLVNDYDLNVAQRSDPADTSRTKVYEWRKRNNSEPFDGNHSSMEQDQTLPENIDEPK